MIRIYEEIADPSRRQILSLLIDGSRNVGQLVEATGLKQPNVSTHLARLREKEIVRAIRQGREVFYSFFSPEIEDVIVRALVRRETICGKPCLHQTSKEYAEAAICGDETSCLEMLDRLIGAHVGVIDLYQNFIVPAMRYVGQWYLDGRIDAAQEHMASAVTERLMTRILQVFAPKDTNGRLAILGCGPNSFHVIGLRMASDLLRINGWKTLFLGANVPTDSFTSQVEKHKPDLVLLGVKAETNLDCGLDLVGRLAEIRQNSSFVIGVGGCCAAQHESDFKRVGADYVINEISNLTDEVLPQIESRSR